MNTEIYRKVALSRLSSPDQLDQMLRVTTPRTWAALAAVVVLLGTIVMWGFAGSIATKVSGQGVIVQSGPVSAMQVVAWVPSGQATFARPGQDAQVSPSSVRREEFGFLRARVTYVADSPATPEALRRSLQSEALVRSVIAEGPVTELRASPEPDPTAPSGLKWSSSRGPNVRLSTGAVCHVEVVTRRQKPYTLVLPYFREKLGLD